MRTAVFPGSFDPFTIGHADVVTRALQLFDKVIVVIGVNADKKNMFSPEERLHQVQACYADEPRVEVVLWSGLLADLALQRQACCLIKGVRSTIDFEYEKTMAAVNQGLSGGQLETVLLYARPEYEHCQSSVVRDLLHHGADVRAYLPKALHFLSPRQH